MFASSAFQKQSSDSLEFLQPMMLYVFVKRLHQDDIGSSRAPQALDLCEQAEAAVSGDDKVGATADKFNEFFGATTNFASVQAFVSFHPHHKHSGQSSFPVTEFFCAGRSR